MEIYVFWEWEKTEHPGLEQSTTIARLAEAEQVTQGSKPDPRRGLPGPRRPFGSGVHGWDGERPRAGGDDHRVGEQLLQGWPNSCRRQLRGGKRLLLAAA